MTADQLVDVLSDLATDPVDFIDEILDHLRRVAVDGRLGQEQARANVAENRVAELEHTLARIREVCQRHNHPGVNVGAHGLAKKVLASDRAKELAIKLMAMFLERAMRGQASENPGIGFGETAELIQAALDAEREEASVTLECADDCSAVQRAAERKADWYRLLACLFEAGEIRILSEDPDHWLEFCGHDPIPIVLDESGLPIETPELRAKLEAVRG